MVAGLDSESASTLPEASMTVARAPAAWASSAVISMRNAANNLKKMRFFTFASFGNFETVAGAADRLEVAGILRVGFDFLPDATDINIHGAGSHVGGVAPDGVEQMVAA